MTSKAGWGHDLVGLRVIREDHIADFKPFNRDQPTRTKSRRPGNNAPAGASQLPQFAELAELAQAGTQIEAANTLPAVSRCERNMQSAAAPPGFNSSAAVPRNLPTSPAVMPLSDFQPETKISLFSLEVQRVSPPLEAGTQVPRPVGSNAFIRSSATSA